MLLYVIIQVLVHIFTLFGGIWLVESQNVSSTTTYFLTNNTSVKNDSSAAVTSPVVNSARVTEATIGTQSKPSEYLPAGTWTRSLPVGSCIVSSTVQFS